MDFEIDPEKATLNRIKHKVRLETAALVFADPLRIERRDDSEENTTGEERRQTLGKVDKVLCLHGTRGKTAFNSSESRKQSGKEELLWT